MVIVVSEDKESACNVVGPGLISGLGRSPGEGNGYPLQYSWLDNLMDRAWWATVHGVTKSPIALMGFPGGTMVKNLCANAGDAGDGFDSWVGKIPWSRE